MKPALSITPGYTAMTTLMHDRNFPAWSTAK
jgi:hypothetical protein